MLVPANLSLSLHCVAVTLITPGRYRYGAATLHILFHVFYFDFCRFGGRAQLYRLHHAVYHAHQLSSTWRYSCGNPVVVIQCFEMKMVTFDPFRSSSSWVLLVSWYVSQIISPGYSNLEVHRCDVVSAETNFVRPKPVSRPPPVPGHETVRLRMSQSFTL